jgi:hypothetical protein
MKIRIKETVMKGKTLPFAREQNKSVKTKKIGKAFSPPTANLKTVVSSQSF